MKSESLVNSLSNDYIVCWSQFHPSKIMGVCVSVLGGGGGGGASNHLHLLFFKSVYTISRLQSIKLNIIYSVQRPSTVQEFTKCCLK